MTTTAGKESRAGRCENPAGHREKDHSFSLTLSLYKIQNGFLLAKNKVNPVFFCQRTLF